MSKINYVSQETLNEMIEELTKMKSAGRAEIAHQIAEAREKGDLKENAEYDAAKEAQGIHEAKIANLENTLAHTRVLDVSKIDTSKVSILSTVKVTNLKLKKSFTYQIVSEGEADLKLGKISVNSPIGKGLLGKTLNEIAEIIVPNGVLQLKIEEISI